MKHDHAKQAVKFRSEIMRSKAPGRSPGGNSGSPSNSPEPRRQGSALSTKNKTTNQSNGSNNQKPQVSVGQLEIQSRPIERKHKEVHQKPKQNRHLNVTPMERQCLETFGRVDVGVIQEELGIRTQADPRDGNQHNESSLHTLE